MLLRSLFKTLKQPSAACTEKKSLETSKQSKKEPLSDSPSVGSLPYHGKKLAEFDFKVSKLQGVCAATRDATDIVSPTNSLNAAKAPLKKPVSFYGASKESTNNTAKHKSSRSYETTSYEQTEKKQVSSHIPANGSARPYQSKKLAEFDSHVIKVQCLSASANKISSSFDTDSEASASSFRVSKSSLSPERKGRRHVTFDIPRPKQGNVNDASQQSARPYNGRKLSDFEARMSKLQGVLTE